MNTKSNFSMSLTRLFALIFLFFVSIQTWGTVTPSVTLTSYYANADGKSGSTLRSALSTIISSNKGSGSAHNVVSYDNIKYLLRYADTENADGTNLIDIYTPCSFDVSGGITWSGSCSGATNVGCGLNREHTIPQSWFDKASPMVSDAFHVYSCDAASNGHRGDYYYGETSNGTSYTGSNCNESGKLGTSSWTSSGSYTVGSTQYTTTGTYSGTVYEPMDEFKGDIARGFFYMATRYASACSSWGEMFGSVNGLTQYTVDLMLKWHRQDPVSEKELIRNEVIYGDTTYNKAGGSYYQGNRNPFIDYPELVEYIWGNKKTTNVDISSLTSAYEGGSSSTTKYTITWSKDGNTDTTTEVKENSRPTPPEAADCDAGRVFMGWTDASTYSGDGSDLMTEQSDFPQATAAATYYAVYADKQTSGGGGSTEITLDATKDTSFPKDGITLSTSNGVLNNGTDYRIYKGATLTIESTVGNMSSIAFTFDGTYDGGGWETSYSPNATTWTSPACTSGSSGKQARITQIIVTVGGGGSTTYSNYSTECTTCEKVTITFNANGGEGSMTAQQVCPSTSVNLSSNTFTREHYSFSGWNTKANGTGSSYADNASVNIDANLTLYAQWTEDDKYTVTFMNNGSAYGIQTNYAGESITGIENPSVCEGYTFEGWSTQTYAVDNTAAATIDYTGTIPEKGATYYAVYTKTEGGSGGSTKYTYNKVTSTSDIEDGDYLIVYETGNVAFNGALTTLDAASNTISVTLSASGDSVTNFATVDAAKFTITADGGNIKSASNKYIGQGSNANGMTSSDNALANTLSIDNGNFVCVSSGGAYLRYNATSGQERFRYFKSSTYSSQQAIQLYKKVGSNTGGGTTYHTTAPDCTPACNATITVQSPDDTMGTVSFE